VGGAPFATQASTISAGYSTLTGLQSMPVQGGDDSEVKKGVFVLSPT